MRRADLILLLDASKGMTAQDEAILAGLPLDIPQLLVFNKADLLGDSTTVSAGIFVPCCWRKPT